MRRKARPVEGRSKAARPVSAATYLAGDRAAVDLPFTIDESEEAVKCAAARDEEGDRVLRIAFYGKDRAPEGKLVRGMVFELSGYSAERLEDALETCFAALAPEGESEEDYEAEVVGPIIKDLVRRGAVVADAWQIAVWERYKKMRGIA